jgi:hypothetical protein
MLVGAILQLVKDGSGNQFRERTIALHAEMVWETYIGQLFGQNPEQLNFYTKSFVVPVVPKDDENSIAYSILPKRIVQVRDAKKGVREITYTKNPGLKFVPVTLLQRKIYPEMEVGAVDDTVGYEVMTNKVLYDNIDPAIKEVQMRLCLPFSQWDINDDLPLPEGIAALIIQETISSMKGEGVQPNMYKAKTT